MPEESIRDISTEIFSNSNRVFRVAKVLGVSSFSLIYRALNLDIIPIVV
jgi:hypothetical protein